MLQGPGQAVNSPLITGGMAQEGGILSDKKDAKEAATATKFGDVYQQIQSKYGAKPDKPREIKKTLGKDDFLKIMVTQLKNQDPTNPFKAEQMATEVAQFTSVEQLQNVNQNLNKMANQNKPMEQMAMTNLIGKVVTIDRDRFPHIEGQNESLKFNLPKDAEGVKVTLVSEAGEIIYEKEIGAQKSGEVSFNWDGKKSNSLPAKSGNFMLRVDAKDSRGVAIETNPQAKAKIIGVSFEGNEPVLLVGNAQHQDKITMRNVVRVELESDLTTGDSGVKPIDNKQNHSPSFISFQKGVGSSSLNPNDSRIKPEVAKALEAYQEKGFPNGLNESSEEQPNIEKGGNQK